ncbi:hypothetical protein DFH06DRAFT_1049677 [Mycena polygramma]|nr:hypothetical protein DFH06DRAFT_1049677 [Mycena polygramma]
MDSPFASILFTNTAPSEADCEKIHALLAEKCKEISFLSQEIIRIQRSVEDFDKAYRPETRLGCDEHLLDELTQKRDALNIFIDAHLSLVSPVRRLPEDIVREIFMACMPASSNAGMGVKEAPLLLCRICSGWRHLALATPELWSSLHIVVSRRSTGEGLAATAKCWLSRSGVLPLSISLDSNCTRAYFPYMSRLLAALAEFSIRWESIDISLRSFDPLDALSHVRPDNVPKLKRASFGRREHVGIMLPCNSLPFLMTASLRSVSVSGEDDPSLMHLPWTQLKHLMLGGQPGLSQPSISGILAVLRRCTQLQTFQLHLSNAEGHFSSNVEPVNHPNLRHLEVSTDTDYRRLSALFMKMLLPNLQSLKLTFRDYRAIVPPPGEAPPLHIFAPSLERLSLDIPGLQGEYLLRLFPLMLHLDELELHGEPALLPAAGADALCLPDARFLAHFGLTHISHFRLFKFKAVSDDTLLAFVRNHAAHLKHFTIHLDRPMQRDISALLQPFIERGVEILIKYSPAV